MYRSSSVDKPCKNRRAVLRRSSNATVDNALTKDARSLACGTRNSCDSPNLVRCNYYVTFQSLVASLPGIPTFWRHHKSGVLMRLGRGGDWGGGDWGEGATGRLGDRETCC